MSRFSLSSRNKIAVGGLTLMMVGGAAGAGAYALTHRPLEDWSGAPRTSIAKLQDDSVAEIDGHVAERFGNRFVLFDATGRALIDIPARETVNVALNETLRVRGRFDDGVMHAVQVIHASGATDTFWPPRPRPLRDRLAECAPQPGG